MLKKNNKMGGMLPDYKTEKALNQAIFEPLITEIQNTYDESIGSEETNNVCETNFTDLKSKKYTNHRGINILNQGTLCSKALLYHYWFIINESPNLDLTESVYNYNLSLRDLETLIRNERLVYTHENGFPPGFYGALINNAAYFHQHFMN